MKSLISRFSAEAVVGAKTEIKKDSRGRVTGGGTTALHAAAEAGKTEMVMFLLENGADPDAEDGISQSPLAFAVKKGHAEAIQLLMKKAKVKIVHDSWW
jgi:hypothetical protein